MLQNLLPKPPKLPIPRLVVWLLVSVVLLAGIALISPQQLPVVLYKIALVTIAAVLAYWLDRTLFPYARPHILFDNCNALISDSQIDAGRQLRWHASLSTLRRALIVLACVLGLTLGL
jgi:hypothetical protein